MNTMLQTYKMSLSSIPVKRIHTIILYLRTQQTFSCRDDEHETRCVERECLLRLLHTIPPIVHYYVR